MTFQSTYAKLLTDPDFGTIKKRKEHAKRMYVEGMERALKECKDAEDHGFAIHYIEQAIAEESK